ncbi:P-loop containing nucleoside triphosphate hydrolase protein [Chaetomium strumarium]|uniref:P-loop containing nucleoside triphosphate hydrolase protein n=1 Tax=Chaetomium strumarium TaxID=1170767 RepID=A0AAJ0H0X2_9PEZI|nr:P-loop containing nucleoside triphosphate hydrolase protein [Chaetomium strumarium]
MERRHGSMAPPARPGVGGRSSIRPPVRNTAATSRAGGTRVSRLARAASPAESLMSVATSATAGAKRKERDFDPDDGGEATNINVVVRCRGRNEREVKENSAVVVRTEATRGKVVDLSMGPNAVSNKTYTFDHVFSQAADQGMIFEDVVRPVLDEMLSGYNCTIFAYGQTGTGKTYTMSGDLTETMGMLSDNAGIIPRVLKALFDKLELDEKENSVRCSFIELYNEELRDLLAPDENAKLKIYDDTSRKGHSTTMVQGMEERYIQNASDGLKWLREGSVKRQVAATKCNDLSSRSHTVFTITVYTKHKTENGEDFLMLGKLNLVDLAGSENIQRSGAENKRAAEAGLINKSLLTLGRVINALVDRSAHIPYRESKLTRLLQDSLGGRTKTCIIATISPAKSNLEETISTLDYAFRAKNIRNKPQLNALTSKKMLLRDFTIEIERLKAELIATRQRNGVYLSNDMYEELTVQNESRRILTEEQAAKIETLEANLKNKVQELLSLTSNFMGLKKEHEGTLVQFDETKELLDQTEMVLAATKKSLAEETHIRRAHQATEQKLADLGENLLCTLARTIGDIDGLHAKNQRKSDLHNVNRSTWTTSQGHVADITELVEGRIEEFRQDQEEHISSISQRMQTFVKEELEKLSSTQAFLDENLARFGESRTQLLEQQERSKQDMDTVLEEIKVVRDNVKQRVGESLQAITAAAERIAGDVLSELSTFHNELHTSYNSLGKDFKSLFEDMLRHIRSQKAESDRLRQELEEASKAIIESNQSVSARIQEVLDEERAQTAAERQALLSQITRLINSQAELQESRLADKAAIIQEAILDSNKTFEGTVIEYSAGMDAWGERDSKLLEDVAGSRDALKARLKDDWTTANKHSTSIQTTTKSVHAETVRIVEEQVQDLDVQMQDLDNFVSRAQSQNATLHDRHAASVQSLNATVEQSFSNISGHFKETFDRVQTLGEEMDADANNLQEALAPLDENICRPLAELRDDIQNTDMHEYEPTGETPEKIQYQYPTQLPRTGAHENLIAAMRDCSPTPSKPSTPVVLPDISLTPARSPTRPSSSGSHHSEGGKSVLSMSMSLREVNANMTTGQVLCDPSPPVFSPPPAANNPALKPNTRSRLSRLSKKVVGVVAEGPENVPPPALRSSTRRKSPRLH